MCHAAVPLGGMGTFLKYVQQSTIILGFSIDFRNRPIKIYGHMMLEVIIGKLVQLMTSLLGVVIQDFFENGQNGAALAGHVFNKSLTKYR